jgi:hypothetical protein
MASSSGSLKRVHDDQETQRSPSSSRRRFE